MTTKINILFWVLILLSIGCAQIVRPTGGPEDTLPPRLILESSTANEQVRFVKQDIVLEFDEFVKLSDPSRQIIISPPLQYNPEIKERGKVVKVKFDKNEILKEDATYVINFGSAIQDFNENNVLDNFRFVFATGDEIDSLEISGTVTDVNTGQPAEDILVMLYDDLRDSVVYEQRPLYFASTDNKGAYQLKNLRADTFKIFVLRDENVNYLYDLDNEAIGFLDSLIIVNDTLSQIIDLQSFVENPAFSLQELTNDVYGVVELAYSDKVDDLEYEISLSDYGQFVAERDDQTLRIWYDVPQDTTFSIYLRQGEEYSDTVRIRKRQKSKFLKDAALTLTKAIYAEGKNISPFEPFALEMNHPLASVDVDSIQIFYALDSIILEDYQIRVDSAKSRILMLEHSFTPDSSYRMQILPGALTDIFGMTNDTTQVDFSVLNPDTYGTLLIDFSDMDTLISYQVELLDGEVLLNSYSIQRDSTAQITQSRLLPKSYQLRITEDNNSNGQWDTGSYLDKRQPERILSFDTGKLKSGWETKLSFKGLEMQATVSDGGEE